MQLNISVLLALLVVVSACNDLAKPVAPPSVAAAPSQPWMDCTHREYQKRDVLKGSIAAHAEAITLPCRSLNPYGPGEDAAVITTVIQRRRAEIGG